MSFGDLTRVVATAALLLAPACWGAEKKPGYPPYPDAWEWFVPMGRGLKLTELHAELLATGDALITATLADSAGTLTDKSWLLFAGHTVDARAVRATTGVVRVPRLESEIGDGFTVTGLSHRYRLCFRGPERSTVVKRDASGHFVARRVIFVLLDEPREFVGGGGQDWFGEENASCPDEGPVHLQYQVASAEGVFLSLPDGTTLLVDAAAGLILRLKDTLEPGAASPSKRVFAFDYGEDEPFIEYLLHKEYRRGEPTPPYQEMLDDLYRFLTDLNRPVPARLLGTWFSDTTAFRGYGDLRITRDRLSWTDCLYEQYRVIGGDGEKTFHVEVVDPHCREGERGLFFIFDFSKRARDDKEVDLWICHDREQLDRPVRERRCSWAVFANQRPYDSD